MVHKNDATRKESVVQVPRGVAKKLETGNPHCRGSRDRFSSDFLTQGPARLKREAISARLIQEPSLGKQRLRMI
jgi:hypothetical protein